MAPPQRILTNDASNHSTGSALEPDRSNADQAALDLILVRRVLSGEKAALGELGARLKCVPAILAVLNRRGYAPLGPAELADLSQSTVLRIWSKLGTFRGDSTFEGWAYRFGALELKNAVRRLSRERSIMRPSQIEMSSYPSPAEDDQGPFDRTPFDRANLEAALQTIPKDMAGVIRLKHKGALAFREVGERLKISENTARSRYYRGIARLREILTREYRGDLGQP